MRGVMERAKDFPTVLVDGVKIVYPEGWALVLPDPELAVTHIWAEGPSDVDARRLVAIHAGQVAELTRLGTLPPHEHSRGSSLQPRARMGPPRPARSPAIGITDFAQDSLGDVVFVQLPDVGLDVVAGASVSEIESTKSVSDVYVPVTGVVSAVNDGLVERPELVNQDPYGEGWMLEIQVGDPSELDGLLDAAAYRNLVESAG